MGGKGSGRYPQGSKAGVVGTESHDNIVRYNKFSTRVRKMEPIDTTDPDEIWRRYEEYVELSTEYGVEQTMGLFSKALGTSWSNLSSIMRGTRTSAKWPQRSIEAVADIYEYIESFAELCLLNPDNKNAAQRIFHMKNRYGWRDLREEHKVVESHQMLPASEQDIAAMAQRYLAQAGVSEAVEVEAEVSDEQEV